MTNIDALVEILDDPAARVDEKDDAIVLLGQSCDSSALGPLLRVGSDNTQDYIVQSSAEEAIATLMISIEQYDADYLVDLTDDAKHEAISLLLSKKPALKNILLQLDK